MSQIVKCTCQHAYQDSLYGAGNRMANEMRTGQLKCTVCGTIAGGKGVPVPVKAAIAASTQKKEEPAPKGKKIDRSRKMNKK